MIMELNCLVCGKPVGGFSKKDVEYKMLMHMMKHRNYQKENSEDNSNSIKSQEVNQNGRTTE